ncbi:MAG: O-antigen ligase family protein [Xanthobacteraceae bacterium]|nr:O-antigen ligase family protein [Xanthobacteraceae bacterium]
MSIDTLPSQSVAGVHAAGDLERALRSVLFLAAFLVTWITMAPFPDLGDPKVLEPVADGNALNQLVTLGMTGTLAAFLLVRHARAALLALTLPLVLTLAWFAVSVVFATHPDLAGRRLILAGFMICNSIALLLLPVSREHFARLLTLAALVVLALCYAGVLLRPQYSIHQPTDVVEPILAGNWRGAFAHKNGAGAAMTLLIFIGIFVARVSNRSLGIAIVALAAFFLVFSQAKSPLLLLPIVLLLSWLVLTLRSPGLTVALVIGVPLGINLLTVGSVMFPGIEALLSIFMSDTTYTGRNEIWGFALNHVGQRPVTGFGFQAFWGTSDLVVSGSIRESWAYRASDAHNGYLNLAVMTGVVGLVLALTWIVAQPLADVIRNNTNRTDPLTMMFVQIWLFGVLLCGFESLLFAGGSALWAMMIMSIVGLRYLVSMPLRGGAHA